ncbi:chorismate mutase [Buchnera aphidicola (Macrosiphoniella sanborni)]|uniref:Bifunctional chorismate mutase/prephenate dehydratase n=1 Tax=Buchnera aphidicola (Macrosiphoniella sanborni) TaxID=1241865 RepID=A0A4D6YD64_9GAMM|nr:chorismate mutase [Buchnera aphidicola]QCI23918.1 chorismate mutase [Buchnera aphidicola (Macrosiphoniella sanborni)]
MPTENSLFFFREQINNIDKKIVKLLAERKYLVLKIAESKIQNKKEIRDLEREKNMLNKLTILAKKNDLKPKYIIQLFQLIIKESVLTQQKILKQFINKNPIHASFSFLGPQGSYSYIAAHKYANHIFQKYNIKACSTFEEVILSVENNQSDYAILPIENTCSGAINEVFNFLKYTSLFIVGEINILINHCLLGHKNVEIDKIQNIYSHPQPFKQCSNFLKKFPKWKIKYTKSTADAMKKVSEDNKDNNAVLGSEIGGKIYGLKILSRNLANEEKNITRFIILHQKTIEIDKEKSNKTTLLFTIEKQSKDLSNLLFTLQKKKIIMKQLTSQISDQNSWEQIFYIDLQLNLSSQTINEILEKIKKFTTFIKILGRYPHDNKIITMP